MKPEIVAYLLVVIDDIKEVNPYFTLGEIWALQTFLKNSYSGPALIEKGEAWRMFLRMSREVKRNLNGRSHGYR